MASRTVVSAARNVAQKGSMACVRASLFGSGTTASPFGSGTTASGSSAISTAAPSGALPRLTVALDLDHTLVSTTFVDPERARAIRGGDLSTIPEGEIMVDVENRVGHVALRPGLVRFLTEAAREADLVLFTAGGDDYGTWAAEMLCEKADMSLFSDVRTRKHCRRVRTSAGYGWAKDLSQLGTDLARTVLIDDKMFSFLAQPTNGLRIEEFRGSPRDDHLALAQDIIHELAHETADVRDVLGPVLMNQTLAQLCREFEEFKREMDLAFEE